MKNIYFILTFCFLFMNSCSEMSSDPDNLFSVSGYVFYNDLPAVDITASIDDKANYTVQTNESGHFEINDVTEGNHQLKLYKLFDDTSHYAYSFSERSYDLSVNNDVNLDYLKLPKAVRLYEPVIINANTIQIIWSPSDVDDFREYKIFRHNTSGLDETTGELVHISTSINDTTYIDNNLHTLSTFYYRVYVMNDYGRLGGSNIVSATTLNANLFPDGGFEEINSLNTYWIIVWNPEHAELDDSIKYAGNYSLHLTPAGGNDVRMRHPFINFLAGQNEYYEISFYYMINGDIDELADLAIMFNYGVNSTPFNGAYVLNFNINPNEWYQFTYTLLLPENEPIEFELITDYLQDVWIDNLTLTRKL